MPALGQGRQRDTYSHMLAWLESVAWAICYRIMMMHDWEHHELGPGPCLGPRPHADQRLFRA